MNASSLRAQALASLGGKRSSKSSHGVESIPVVQEKPPTPSPKSEKGQEERRPSPPRAPARRVSMQAPVSRVYPFRHQEAAVNNVILHQRQALRARNEANASIFDGLRSWACDQIALHKAPVAQIKVYK